MIKIDIPHPLNENIKDTYTVICYEKGERIKLFLENSTKDLSTMYLENENSSFLDITELDKLNNNVYDKIKNDIIFYKSTDKDIDSHLNDIYSFDDEVIEDKYTLIYKRKRYGIYYNINSKKFNLILNKKMIKM